MVRVALSLATLIFFGVTINCDLVIPKDHEVTYEYETRVNTKIDGSVPTSTSFTIKSNLMAIGSENEIQFRFRDVKLKQSSEDGVMEMTLDPKESFHLPFVVQYGSDGKATGVMADKDDPVRSLNMKKAIAAMFQMDLTQAKMENRSSYGFTTDEFCVYGSCETLYTVHPNADDNKMKVEKHFTPSPKNVPKDIHIKLTNPGRCLVDNQSPLSFSMDRTYDLEQHDGMMVIDRVEASNIFSLTPFDATDDLHTIVLNQKLKKIEMKKVDALDINKDGMQYHKIKLNWMSEAVENDFDFSGSNRVWDKESLAEFMEQLKRFNAFLKENDIVLSATFFKTEETARFLLGQMKTFTAENLKECYKMMEDTSMQKMFLGLVPLLGTRSSALLIADIVTDSKLEDDILIMLLQDIPFSIKKMNMDLVNRFMSLREDENVNATVRDVVTLTTASLVTKFIEANPNDQAIGPVVDRFINMFKSAENNRDRVFMMNVLFNIKSKNVTKMYEEIIRGEIEATPHIRSLAMFGAKKEHSECQEALNKYYWPCLQDESENLELRVTALNVLMTKPTKDNLLKMYWWMTKETKKELYNTYYTLLKSIAHSKLPCAKTEAYRARRIFQMPHRPMFKDTHSVDYMLDYFDSKVGTGTSYRATVISVDYANYYFEYLPMSSTMDINNYAVYYHMALEPDSSCEDECDFCVRRYGWDAYHPIFRDNMTMESALIKNGRVINFNYGPMLLNDDNIALDYLRDKLMETNHEDRELFLPTDMGVPVSYYASQFEFGMHDQEMSGTKKMSRHGRFRHKTYGLKVYNPYADNWQGTRRNDMFRFNFPISVDRQGKGFAIVNDKKGTMGFKSFASGEVFTEMSQGMDPKTSCPVCAMQQITRVPAERATTKIHQKQSDLTGMTYNFGSFDCEIDRTRKLYDIAEAFIKDGNKNWVDFPQLKIVMALKQMWMRLTSAPASKQCGFGMVVRPNFEKLEVNLETGSDGDHFKKNRTADLKVSISWIDGNTTDWSMKVQFDSQELESTNFKIHVKKGEKMACLEAEDRYGDQQVDFKYGFYYGKTENGECPMEQRSIVVEGNAKPSKEQMEVKNLDSEFYNMCIEREELNMVCSMKLTTLREYNFNGTTKNFPGEYRIFLTSLGVTLAKMYPRQFTKVRENNDLPEGEFTGTITYPLLTNTMDTRITTRYLTARMDNMLLDSWPWLTYIIPQNNFFSNIMNLHLMSMREFNEIAVANFVVCEVKTDYHKGMYDVVVERNMTDEWTLYGEDLALTNVTGPWKVELKKIDGKQMAMRVTLDKEVLEISMKDGFDFKLNDESFAHGDYGYGKGPWFNYKLVANPNRVLLNIKKLSMNIDFDGEMFLMNSPFFYKYGKGLCFVYEDGSNDEDLDSKEKSTAANAEPVKIKSKRHRTIFLGNFIQLAAMS